ncbi:MAG TPA: hypothetical protein VGY56_19070 [Verrucomicrobiae bacterium]|nr:hypothetical protein [Verrucomicrobiae bacterium]
MKALIVFLLATVSALSQRAAWQEEFNPSKNPIPGVAVPFIIRPAQFFYKDMDWTNVPEGKHVVLAHAYDFHGFSEFSKPMHIIVLPPLPPRPVNCRHEATGPPRPALRPEQVRINHRAPRADYHIPLIHYSTIPFVLGCPGMFYAAKYLDGRKRRL